MKKLAILLILLFVAFPASATYKPFKEDQKTAFGELLTADLTPVVQIQSSYNINTRVIEARDNKGTSSINDNKFQVSTGAAANQSSTLF